MHGQCNIGWLSRRQTRQNSTLSIVDIESVLPTSENTASVGVVHESIAVTSALDEYLNTVNGPEVGLDSTLCTPDVLGELW